MSANCLLPALVKTRATWQDCPLRLYTIATTEEKYVFTVYTECGKCVRAKPKLGPWAINLRMLGLAGEYTARKPYTTIVWGWVLRLRGLLPTISSLLPTM